MAKKGGKFDLANKEVSGPRAFGGRRVLSEAEQLESLKGYLEVPREYIEYIKYGTYVRYVTEGDGYHPGGLVQKNPFDATGASGSPVRYMKLHAGKPGTKDYKTWSLRYDEIVRIYTKPNEHTKILIDNIQRIAAAQQKNFDTIMKSLEDLQDRVKRLERKLRDDR